ncbi:photosynthetic reaction center cytochrome PufC [Novosphingopyxis sp. YJ-S2-01]|uniref:photosynthetic reaction center cytochrome PufC n=1 Tax=Novosphingopyxis sp. YJ-S2-01 TaxID=2794021 RepID=UPI0018DBFB14|nr:photosynthetic reaction center cytochrome PufC [Novosphingopyxis sp. YJ-S2-01]MBH9536772.1 photosynthetic reaction center cytochrome c subunit [Novosphingopyxis sp. YJ-S2-01]
MIRDWILPGAAAVFAVVSGVTLIPKWSLPPILSTDYGPAAGEMVVFKDSRAEPNPAQPEFLPVAAGGPSASAAYQNVKVLGTVSKAEFDRTMAAMTAWVSPDKGCAFCHQAGEPYSADNPRKEIARQMLVMTRTVNANWTNHVGSQGITCFSCHAGKNLPDSRWFVDAPLVPPEGGIVGKPQPWNTKAKTIREFFPTRPNRMFLLEGKGIGKTQQAQHPLVHPEVPESPQHDRDYAEQVYILMMQMSDGLGVNCTYCHNSRALFDWSQSPPNRLNGYSGIAMTTMMNQNYLAKLAPLTETKLLGKMGDSAKADCKTCHQGQEKPTGGMINVYYPALIGPPPEGPYANPLAAANPAIPQFTRHPKVGYPATDTLVQYEGEPQR